MPGRGNPWQKGGHVDDTILSEDIAPGSIQESDLDSSLQTKVNSGGGNVEVILDAVAPSSLISHTFNFTRSPDLDGTDVGLIKIIISNITLSLTDVIDIGFNGDTTGMQSLGVSSNGTTVTAVQDNPVTDGVSMQVTGGTIIIEIPGDINQTSNVTGNFAKFSDNGHYSNVVFDFGSNAFDPLVSITIKTRGGIKTINAPTRIVAYAYNKD